MKFDFTPSGGVPAGKRQRSRPPKTLITAKDCSSIRSGGTSSGVGRTQVLVAAARRPEKHKIRGQNTKTQPTVMVLGLQQLSDIITNEMQGAEVH